MPGRIERGAHDHAYTVIENAALRDERLSWKARGILGYLLTKPDNWTVMAHELEAAAPDGRASVRAGLAELERFGYLERVREVTRLNGRMTTALSTTLRESPRGGNLLSVDRGAETGRYEVPTTESSKRRKSSPGGVQSPLVAVVPGELPEWMRERDRLTAARARATQA